MPPQYKDKQREKQRRKQLQKASAPVAPAAPTAKQPPKAEKHLPAAKRRQLSQRQELADLSDDYRLLKKLKKGKISEVRIIGTCRGLCSGTAHHDRRSLTLRCWVGHDGWST